MTMTIIYIHTYIHSYVYIEYVLLYIPWVQNLVKLTTEGGIKVIKNTEYTELIQYKVIITSSPKN